VVTKPKVVFVAPSGRAAFRGVDRAAAGIESVIVPEGLELDGSTAFESLLEAEPIPVADLDPSDVAILIFTAGTSGGPKAAQLTHGNLLANLEQVQSSPAFAIRADDVGLCVLPLFHIYGLNSVLGLGLYAGATLVLAERFDPADTLGLIEEQRVTTL